MEKQNNSRAENILPQTSQPLPVSNTAETGANSPTPTAYVGYRGASIYLGRPIQTIKVLVMTKRLSYYKDGRSVYFKLSDLDEYMSRLRVSAEGGDK